jgi:hypothetical protein
MSIISYGGLFESNDKENKQGDELFINFTHPSSSNVRLNINTFMPLKKTYLPIDAI